jgi:hypothetical protein
MHHVVVGIPVDTEGSVAPDVTHVERYNTLTVQHVAAWGRFSRNHHAIII